MHIELTHLTSLQGKSQISPISVNPKSVVPPYDDWLPKYESIKAAIPKHCFEHSYVTSFRYLFVDIAVSAARFYAVSVLEQLSLHPAVSALLYCPSHPERRPM